MRRAVETARGITPGSGERVPVENLPSEVRPLAKSANMAMARLQDALQSERLFLSDGAHEVRMPLTVLDLHLQRLCDGSETK